MIRKFSRRQMLQLMAGAATSSGVLGTLSACQSPIDGSAIKDLDYIIVGAGSAGNVLAARLTEQPNTKVLVLEAGPDSADPLIDDSLNWFRLTFGNLVWKNQALPQIHANSRELLAPHGKLVGGSSAINAMIHHRPTARDINDWNLNAWRWDDLEPMFRKSETWMSGSNPKRGSDGPIKVMRLADGLPFADATLAASERLGYGVTEDVNGSESIGAALNQLAYDGAQRQHTGRAYLDTALTRPGTLLQTNAQVTNLAFDGDRCIGVKYQVGEEKRAATAANIILAAGALRSPKLLMQAGIGPADHLNDVGIATRLDLPSVGENLHDHMLIVGNNFATAKKVQGAQLHGSAAVVYATSEYSDGARDIMLNVSTTPTVFPPLETPEHGFKTTFSFTKPKSRGRLRLAGADPLLAPLVDHNIYSHPTDLKGGMAALNVSRDILNAPEFGAFAGVEQNTAYFKNEASIREFLIAGSGCFGHHSGTCRMGEDDDAVVDEHLKVRGVTGLYVMDASVIPTIPSCPTNSLVVAMAELAAQKFRNS